MGKTSSLLVPRFAFQGVPRIWFYHYVLHHARDGPINQRESMAPTQDTRLLGLRGC